MTNRIFSAACHQSLVFHAACKLKSQATPWLSPYLQRELLRVQAHACEASATARDYSIHLLDFETKMDAEDIQLPSIVLSSRSQTILCCHLQAQEPAGGIII